MTDWNFRYSWIQVSSPFLHARYSRAVNRTRARRIREAARALLTQRWGQEVTMFPATTERVMRNTPVTDNDAIKRL